MPCINLSVGGVVHTAAVQPLDVDLISVHSTGSRKAGCAGRPQGHGWLSRKQGQVLINLALLCVQEMDARMMEVLVFVDGVDAMTSKVMQARRSYEPSEMMLNEQVGATERLRGYFQQYNSRMHPCNGRV